MLGARVVLGLLSARAKAVIASLEKWIFRNVGGKGLAGSWRIRLLGSPA